MLSCSLLFEVISFESQTSCCDASGYENDIERAESKRESIERNLENDTQEECSMRHHIEITKTSHFKPQRHLIKNC